MRTPDEERDRLERGIPPEWASEWGEDEYGVFAGFEVAGVVQRMRWIEPGRFWMGSPQGEVGRYDDEGPRHEVELTRGYWLAETQCTQALWSAVMGSNPSEHQSPRRSVEQVSWDDVQEFLRELGRRVKGLEPGLPTEAEWECACRAGTETATYVGDLRDQRIDERLDEVAWYWGNSQDGTKEVRLKRPNIWGLYDMLGNVHEWCADGRRDYAEGFMRDPIGPSGPGKLRVIRGGSWGGNARLVRAAYRYWREPGRRTVYLGFRLCRGQGLRQASQASEQGRGSKGGDRPATRPAAGTSPGDATGSHTKAPVHHIRTTVSRRGGVEMVRVSGGTFMMGSPDDDVKADDAEKPRHEVTLSDFYLARTPVTNAQYSKYLAANPSAPRPEYWGDEELGRSNQPVVGVSWNEAVAYCEWAGLTLPTEAQWEYACRGGTTTRYHSGDTEEDLARVGWYAGNSDGRLHAVAELQPNAFGLYDMHGNIYEWCRDAWLDNFGGALHRPSDGLRVEPVGDADRVVRGGYWLDIARLARSACRGHELPEDGPPLLGFRPAMGIP